MVNVAFSLLIDLGLLVDACAGANRIMVRSEVPRSVGLKAMQHRASRLSRFPSNIVVRMGDLSHVAFALLTSPSAVKAESQIYNRMRLFLAEETIDHSRERVKESL